MTQIIALNSVGYGKLCIVLDINVTCCFETVEMAVSKRPTKSDGHFKPKRGFEMSWPFQNYLTGFHQAVFSILTSNYKILVVMNL